MSSIGFEHPQWCLGLDHHDKNIFQEHQTREHSQMFGDWHKGRGAKIRALQVRIISLWVLFLEIYIHTSNSLSHYFLFQRRRKSAMVDGGQIQVASFLVVKDFQLEKNSVRNWHFVPNQELAEQWWKMKSHKWWCWCHSPLGWRGHSAVSTSYLPFSVISLLVP